MILDLDNIMLSEISQSEKDKCHIIKPSLSLLQAPVHVLLDFAVSGQIHPFSLVTLSDDRKL